MIRYAFVGLVVAAGLLIAGPALAQSVASVPPPHVGHNVHVGDSGHVGSPYPLATAENVPAAPASPTGQTPPGTYDNSNGYGTNWQSGNGGTLMPNATRADAFTFALNDLYSHGFHGVHHLWMRGAAVHASVVTPNGARRRVTVQPDSGQISLG